ncbi:MAG: outer membrane protein assembly factor BamC [Gammaproteobacteria bacterium]
MPRLKIPAVILTAALLASCSGSPPETRRGKDSRDEAELFASQSSSGGGRAALQVPPDLLASSNEKVRENATADSAVTAAATTDSAAAEKVLPQVIGASIQRDAKRAWLKVDAEAEVVWRKLTEFWEYQKVELVTRTPRAGLMETDWFAKGGSKSGVTAELIAALTARRTALDKFTLRLERNAPGGTNVYVSHRARERIVTEYANRNKANDYEWVEREQDAEKVAQLLQAIVLLFERA